MSKIFELIRPKSVIDSLYEDYEYLIRWIGRDGSDYLYMFYDAELQKRIDNETVNQEDSDNIQSLVDRVGQSVTLTANDLSKSDLVIISQILENTYVSRLKKDGTFERYAPDSNRFSYRLLDGRYNLEFTLIMPDIKSWR